MGLRDRLKRAEQASRVHTVEIRREDGTVARFPQSSLRDAFTANVKRIRGGEDVPPEHPLTSTAKTSLDASWQGTFFSPVEVPGEPVEELYE